MHTADLVRMWGVANVGRHTSPFDPGYDPATVAAHLDQSGHLISRLKLSMSQWLIGKEEATLAKVAAAKRNQVALVTGGAPFEISQAKGCLDEYFTLVASLGIERVEVGEGFTHLLRTPAQIVAHAAAYGLEVQAELGEKHGGAFDDNEVDRLIGLAYEWLDAGAQQIVVEGRESAQGIGLYDESSRLNTAAAELFASRIGLDRVVFETPTKRSQFDMIDLFGQEVNISNVRMEELLRVEIYRRGLHADSYQRFLGGRPAGES